MEKFYERLQWIAFDGDFEQADVARLAKIDPATVNKWWNGKREPGPKNTKILCNLFDCEYRWLKYGDGEGPEHYKNKSIRQTAKNHSKIKNSGGDMIKNSGDPNSIKLSALERAAIELNREYGNDAMLRKFMASVEELKKFIEEN